MKKIKGDNAIFERCSIKSEKVLQCVMPIKVRFNEVDSMGIVWHGNYVEYLELAREEFGRKYGLTYLGDIYANGYYAPVVRVELDYKRMLGYQEEAFVRATYVPTISSKVCFDYEIFTKGEDGKEIIVATAKTIQVFTDLQKNLVLENPDFYKKWKEKWL